MSKEIKAIETVYDGYRFRSRLEAKWAVFFNKAHIKYVYEPEGVELPNGERYLPDFYLPELETHVEVKGKWEGYEEDILKLDQFIVWGGPIKQIVILSDVPGETEDGGIWHFPSLYYSRGRVDSGWFFFYDGGDKPHGVSGNVSAADYPLPHIHMWNIKRGDFSIDPRSDYEMRESMGKPVSLFSDNGFKFPSSWEHNVDTANALAAARAARFEFGERP